jgi:hypothetical protein
MARTEIRQPENKLLPSPGRLERQQFCIDSVAVV